MTATGWPWLDFARDEALTPAEGRLWRLVESQEQVATRSLVDSLAEQALLEDMLEGVKPPRMPGCERLHYLLATPFRYPPLPWGSRFGQVWEPGIFYGACALPTALAEAAHYRLLFWQGMSLPPKSGALVTQHLAFSADYRCRPGARLQQGAWLPLQAELRHVSDYRLTQALGSWLRTQDVTGFEYVSVRCPQAGINVALLRPQALVSAQPVEQQHWLCETRAGQVHFSGPGGLHRFTEAEVAFASPVGAAPAGSGML